MSTTLLPQAFWFRLAMPCRRCDELPRAGAKGRLLALPPTCVVPDLAPLEGKTSWAEIRAAWSPRGLGFVVETRGAAGPSGSARDDQPEGAAAFQLWIDTR